VVTTALARWLTTLDADRLSEILAQRRDTLAAPVPEDLLELADRLNARASVAEAFHALPQPAVQLIEALQSLTGDDPVARDDLAALLGRRTDDPEFAAILSMLADLALVWPDGDALVLADPLHRAFAHPLHLGRPLTDLLGPKVATDLKRIADMLHRPPQRLKRDIMDDLVGWLSNPVNVTEIVATAPPAARKLLDQVAVAGPRLTTDVVFSGYHTGFPPEVGWAIDRGLLVSDGWQLAEMPREVALALRGPDWRAPFTPQPPSVGRVRADGEAVRREAAVAAGTALDEVAALLDVCSAAPIALRKSGGVGVRELRRLAKATGVAEPTVRLWLELAVAADLLTTTELEAVVTSRYDEWRAAEPARRLAALLEAWWVLPALPLLDAGPDDAPRPAPLSGDALGRIGVEIRHVVLSALGALPPGTGAAADVSLAPLASWYGPLPMSLLPDPDGVVAALRKETELLGVTAHGAVSDLGRAILDGDSHAAVSVADGMVAAPVREAVFQADLTAVVAGSPSAELATLLDGCADRESRGAASIWRFSATSVRRALDAGVDSDELVAKLRAVAARSAIPQPLEYLIADLSRRHGALRVRAVGCVIHSEDTALLNEIAAARALTGLKLRLIAPTVLASVRAPAETLDALRHAGYAPIGEDVTGSVVVELVPRRRAEAAPAQRIRAPQVTSTPEKLAEKLLATPIREPARVLTLPVRRADSPQETIAQLAPQLSRFQARLLADAVEHGTPIRIEYTNAQGTPSRRIIEPLELDGHLLEAFCHLRDDERVFSLDRIESVSPA
jgi:hypothetical protein